MSRRCVYVFVTADGLVYDCDGPTHQGKHVHGYSKLYPPREPQPGDLDQATGAPVKVASQ